MDRLHHILGMISDSAINFRNGTYLLVILNVYSILSMNFPALGLIEGCQFFFGSSELRYFCFLEYVMSMPYFMRDINQKGYYQSSSRRGTVMVHSTLAHTETETDNRDTEQNGNLCSYPSLCSMNTSIKFYTSHSFSVSVSTPRCWPVWTHHKRYNDVLAELVYFLFLQLIRQTVLSMHIKGLSPSLYRPLPTSSHQALLLFT